MILFLDLQDTLLIGLKTLSLFSNQRIPSSTSHIMISCHVRLFVCESVCVCACLRDFHKYFYYLGMKLQKQHLCMRRCCFLQKNTQILKSCLLTNSKEDGRDTVELVFNTPSNSTETIIVNCPKQGIE